MINRSSCTPTSSHAASHVCTLLRPPLPFDLYHHFFPPQPLGINLSVRSRLSTTHAHTHLHLISGFRALLGNDASRFLYRNLSIALFSKVFWRAGQVGGLQVSGRAFRAAIGSP